MVGFFSIIFGGKLKMICWNNLLLSLPPLSPFLKILTKEQKINPFLFNAFILKTDARKWWKKLKNKIELTVRFRSVYVNIGEGEISNLIKIVFGLLKSLKSVVGTNFTSSYAFSEKRSEVWVSHQLYVVWELFKYWISWEWICAETNSNNNDNFLTFPI